MAYDIIILVISLVALAKFSNITVKNAMEFSRASGINQMAVGFLIIATSTSFPELSIAIISSFEGQGIFSIGNIFGANISDLVLVFGLLAFYKFRMKKFDADETYSILILSSIIAFFIVILQRIDFAMGLFLLIIFYTFSRNMYKDTVKKDGHHEKAKKDGRIKYFVYLILSIAVVVISANFVVSSAVSLARMAGVDAAIIGATIVAIGTTVPELSVALAAIRKNDVELAIGDSVGSLVTNTTLIIGIAGIINPIAINFHVAVAAFFMISACMLFMFICRSRRFSTTEGIVLLSFYALYIIAMFSVGGL